MVQTEIPRELEDFILRRLAETADRNKVIEETCLEGGFHWKDAEQIVDHLIRFHQFDLTRRQSPLLVLAALSIFIGGVILVAWNLLGVWNYLWPLLDPQTPDTLGFYLFYSDLFQTLLFYPQAIPLFITGLAMIAGSYFGMKDVWASIFDFLEHQRQFSLRDFTNWTFSPSALPASEPDPAASGNPSQSEFIPDEELLDYLLDRLETEQSEIQLVEELWLKFGLDKDTGAQFVSQVLAARGQKSSSKLPVTFLLMALAAVFTGLVWVLQYLLLISEYLAAHPRQIENQWHFILRLGDLADCVEQFPGLFGWFILGLVLLAGGLYGLYNAWPSIFILKKWRS